MLAWRQRDGCVSIFRSSWAGGRGNRRVMDRRGDSCAAPEASDGDPHGAARWDEALAGGQGGNAKPVRSASPCASGAPTPPIDPEPSDTADREPRLVIPSASPAPRPLQPEPPSPPQSGLQQGGWARLAPLGLMCVLTVQAVLSMRLIWSNTAFLDEATYLYVGHVELAHWLTGSSVPAYPTYLSGVPVIYPPLAALANDVGGLAAARILSLCFMLGGTSLLWGMTSRLADRRSAFFAAAIFAALGPTQYLGAFATYDAMALFLMTAAAWCVVAARDRADSTLLVLAGAALLALANATKYATGGLRCRHFHRHPGHPAGCGRALLRDRRALHHPCQGDRRQLAAHGTDRRREVDRAGLPARRACRGHGRARASRSVPADHLRAAGGRGAARARQPGKTGDYHVIAEAPYWDRFGAGQFTIWAYRQSPAPHGRLLNVLRMGRRGDH